jgi:hypothetical protein
MYKTLSILFISFFLLLFLNTYVLAAFLYYRLFILVFFSTIMLFSKNRFSQLSDMNFMYMYSSFSLCVDWKHQKRPFLFSFILKFVYYISTCNFEISFILFFLAALLYVFATFFCFPFCNSH